MNPQNEATAAEHAAFSDTISSLERSWTAKAAQHAQAAEASRDRKQREMAATRHAPESARKAMELEHDRRIDHHDRRSRVMARRSEAAKGGYLLMSPDEHNDAEFQRNHSQAIHLAHKCGRAVHSSAATP